MSRKHAKRTTDSEKLDAILTKLDGIDEKVDRQNQELAQLKSEVQCLESLVNEMSRKNRRASVIAGGVGGGLVALGFELMKLKFGG